MQHMQLDNEDLKQILEKQNDLISNNNRLLHKIHRYEMIAFWSKLIWYALLIGAPFALYYYVLDPYFEALGSSYSDFSSGVQELPGLKHLESILEVYKSADTTE